MVTQALYPHRLPNVATVKCQIVFLNYDGLFVRVKRKEHKFFCRIFKLYRRKERKDTERGQGYFLLFISGESGPRLAQRSKTEFAGSPSPSLPHTVIIFEYPPQNIVMSLSPPLRRLSSAGSSSKESLINAYEAEEERIINVLSRKLEKVCNPIGCGAGDFFDLLRKGCFS